MAPSEAGSDISAEMHAHSRDAALSAARARIRALETQLGVIQNVGANQRGAAALAASADLAATRAERDSLQASLEKAEKRALAAARQQRSERDRRTALAATLKQKEAELTQRVTSKEATSAAARLLGRIGDRESNDTASAPHRIGCSLLRAELRSVESLAMATAESMQVDLFDALSRAAEAERVLATELLATERLTVEDAQQKATVEAEGWQREAALQARMKAAQEDARSEARRAAALEAALAAEGEARRRDAKAASSEAEALREQFMQLDNLEREQRHTMTEDALAHQEALVAEAAEHAKAAIHAQETLKKFRAAHESGSHACLVLRIGARSICELRLRCVLHLWRSNAVLAEYSRQADGLKEEVRGMMGKIATLKVQKQRSEELIQSDAKKAEEEVQKKLVLAQRKLTAVEERRRFLEREMQTQRTEVWPARSNCERAREA